MSDRLRDLRTQYETAGLDRGDLVGDPIQQWQRWFDDALQAGCVEPHAMVLSSVDAEGLPASRYVLVRGAADGGFVFFTNYNSPKGRALEAWPYAAGLFSWLQLHRQFRVRGTVTRVSEAESDAYFASRPRGSQIGAWSSPQSQAIADRAELDGLVASTTARFADVENIPRPPQWGGFRLSVVEAEAWQGRPSRLHDRFRYRRAAPRDLTSDADAGESAAWVIERLAP